MNGHVEWSDRTGQAWWVRTVRVPCDAVDHHATYEDDYGSLVLCPGRCDSDGMVHRRASQRAPQFDAPQPPPNWEPPSLELELV